MLKFIIQGGAYFFKPTAPVSFLLKLDLPFPEAVLKKNSSNNGSIHASSIISSRDDDIKETLKIWFSQAIAVTTHFQLSKPNADERQATSSREFLDYKASIENLGLGLGVWDVQDATGDTTSIILEDSNGTQKKLSGRADFIIASNHAHCRAAASQYAVCIVEKQSKPNDEYCEYQLVTYLVIMMNAFGLQFLAGILLYNNGTCRAYRAKREVTGSIIFEQNDTFDLYQIAEVLPALLNDGNS
jgi:hypothetical protein